MGRGMAAEMKRFDLHLTALSPLLIGDRRADTQYTESLDYIPGSRLRAAFARAILSDCPLFDPAEVRGGRRWWVEYQGRPACERCWWAAWCRHFGELRFTQATPGGARILPLTAMGCKLDCGRSGVVDTLLRRVAWQQRLRERPGEDWQPSRMSCVCGGRLENRGGWYDHRAARPVRGPRRQSYTRLMIDPIRGAAAQGQLYTLLPLAPGARFTAQVEAPALPPCTEIRVGARITTGMGRCAVSGTEAQESEDVGQRIRRFQAALEAARQAVGLGPAGDVYLALTLLSSALVGPLSGGSPAELETAESRRILARALGLDRLFPGAELAHVFTGYELKGGWRLSDGGWAESRHYLVAGSVLVLRVPPEDAGELVQRCAEVERLGIGDRTEDGFGQVEVCASYHVQEALR